MRESSLVFLCARVNYRKWPRSPNVWTVAVVLLAFAVWNLAWVDRYCFATGMRITPWVAPFLLTIPPMFTAYGCLALLLFCNAPFADAHTPFVMIRTGKAAWIKGQLLYIFSAALAFVLFFYLSSLLVLAPCLGWAGEWGTVIRVLANDPQAPGDYGILASGMGFVLGIVNNMQPLSATLLSLLLMWLVASFLGVLILACNVVLGGHSGVVAAGVFIFLAYLVAYVGYLYIGAWLYYVSPISWASMICLSPFFEGGPSLLYAVCALTGAIIFLSVTSVLAFCKKDANIQRGA